MRSRALAFVLLLSFFNFASFACALDRKPAVGVILALSGDWSPFAKAMQNGMLLARDSLPESDRNDISLIFEDDQLKAVNSVSAFKKLTEIDNVQALVCWSSGTCKAVAPLAERKQIPMIAIASDPSVARGTKYVQTLWVTPEEETRMIIPEALKRGYRRIAIVATTSDGAEACSAALRKQGKGHFEFVFDENFPADIRDFRSVVTRIQHIQNVDAVLINFLPGQLGVFARQARQAGISAEFFGYENMEDESEIKAADGALEGAWFATASVPANSFVDEYNKRFPGASLVTAANGHDAFLLIHSAVRRSSHDSSLLSSLREIRNFAGASGPISAGEDNRYLLPATLKKISGGKVSPVINQP